MRHPAIDEASHPELLEMFHQMLGLACRAASRVTGHFIGWPWLAGRSAATGVRCSVVAAASVPDSVCTECKLC